MEESKHAVEVYQTDDDINTDDMLAWLKLMFWSWRVIVFFAGFVLIKLSSVYARYEGGHFFSQAFGLLGFGFCMFWLYSSYKGVVSS